MSKQILRNCYVEVNSVDFSSHCSSVEINLSKDDIDTTNFGGNGREHAHGLQDNSFVLNLQQDFAAAEVDSVLYPLWHNETEFSVVIRPTAAVVGPSNPEFSGECIFLEYKPLAGSVGELSETSITCVVQRDTFDRVEA